MKALILTALLLTSSALYAGQKDSADQVTLVAEQETRDSGIIKLRGHVQVITSSIIVYADEAEYSPLTGGLDARGHLRIDLKKPPNVQVRDATPEDTPLRYPNK